MVMLRRMGRIVPRVLLRCGGIRLLIAAILLMRRRRGSAAAILRRGRSAIIVVLLWICAHRRRCRCTRYGGHRRAVPVLRGAAKLL